MRHRLILDDAAHDLWLVRRSSGDVLLTSEGEIPLRDEPDAVVAVDGDTVHIHLDGRAYVLRYDDPLDRFAHVGDGKAEDVARAPMPGSVVSVGVAAGDAVRAGDTMMIIESMKLETAIKAARDGVVDAVHVELGQSFDRDAVLVTLAPAQEG